MLYSQMMTSHPIKKKDVISISILHGNSLSLSHLSKDIYFKELAYMTVEAISPKSVGAGQQGGNSGKS
jgi:hypothetical protein